MIIIPIKWLQLGIYPIFRQTHLLADSNLCFLGPGDWLHFTAQEVIVGSGTWLCHSYPKAAMSTMPTPSVQLFPSAVADFFSISKLWNPMLSHNKFINHPSELYKNDEVPIKLASFWPQSAGNLGLFQIFQPWTFPKPKTRGFYRSSDVNCKPSGDTKSSTTMGCVMKVLVKGTVNLHHTCMMSSQRKVNNRFCPKFSQQKTQLICVPATLWLFNSSPWKMAHRNRWFTY